MYFMLYTGICKILMYMLLDCLYGILIRKYTCAILTGKLNHLLKLLNQVLYLFNLYFGHSHALNLNWALGVLVVIFMSVSVHQDKCCGNTLKYAMNTFFLSLY
jgi:hypothetical protein